VAKMTIYLMALVAARVVLSCVQNCLAQGSPPLSDTNRAAHRRAESSLDKYTQHDANNPR